MGTARPKDTILFTKGKTWWSNLICEILQEPLSHVAVLRNGSVYHSDLLGVRKESEAVYMARQEKVIKVDVKYITDLEEKYEEHKHSWYDFGGMLFLGLSFLARRYLKIPLPKSNLWQASGMFICTEWVTKTLGKVNSLITPWGLYKQTSKEK